MHQPTEPEPTRQDAEQAQPPQLCCHCGNLTAQPVRVGEVHTASGAGRDLYACRKHAQRYETQAEGRP